MFADLVKHIAGILGVLRTNYSDKSVREGIRECDKATRRIRNSLRGALPIGEKQHHEACLRNIKSMRKHFKLEQKRGQGIALNKETAKHRVHWDDSISAFSNRIRTGVITNLKHKDPSRFLVDCKVIFKRQVFNALKKDEAVKVNAIFCGEFVITQGEKTLNEYKYFTTSNAAIYRGTDIEEWFEEKVSKPLMKKLSEFQECNSGWALRAVVNLGVNFNKFTPQLGSSYVELPPQIQTKKACVNVKNEDHACFAWAVVSALYPADKHPQRISKYPHYSSVLKLKGIQFPMTMRQISNFEKQNNISINVYILKKEKKDQFSTLPTYLTKEKMDKHVNLLLVQDCYEQPTKFHYVWIKNLSRLVSKKLGKRNGQKYVCDRCLHYFHSEDKLIKHTGDCMQKNDTAIKMPTEEKKMLKFKNFKNKIKAPFVVYADLESVLKPSAKKTAYQQHIPAAVGYYFKCSYDESLSFYNSYRGEDCMRWFADEMNQLAEDVSTVFLCPYKMQMTPQQEIEFQTATHCHICEQPFTAGQKKVRDHNHLIPENNFRGAACEICNVNYQDTHTIPVVFHNLSGYDAHFLITDIATRMGGKIDLLPITKEKYISFTKHINESRINFRFIDSFRFMASSLDKLSSALTEFPNLKSQFFALPEDQFNLLTKKGIMPYDYLDSFTRFDEPCLPPQDAFYNKLEDKPCPRRMYRRAQEVWSKFNCNNLGQYVELYMKTDILLLADVFELFRSSCISTYDLDPAHYFTLPGFTWDAMLKHTRQELELLTDQDMFLFIERGIRGGLSQVCSKRRVHANNKYMPKYDSAKPDVYLMYNDINNQYGWSMSQYLPYGGFQWVDANIDVTMIPDDANEGYILEVDLEYPKQLHDLHQDLPFCALHINPKTMKPPSRAKETSKLMATLNNKEKYVIHYRALKQALAHGLVLTKVHRVLKFKQSPWLKSYIDLNTNLRRNAKNEFEKNLFKLMNNAVFGKTMENVRKRLDVKLLSKWEGRYGAESYISKPEFKSCVIFNENLVAVEMNKLEVYLNKPIYVGQAILDLAKTTIYSFHYDYMMDRFGGNCTAVYTDTDSLIYEIREQDPYMVIKSDCFKYYDTSDFNPNNPYDIPLVNKKVLGMMKDENNGKVMTDYVGLRSKLYTTKVLTTKDDLIKLRQKLEAEEYEEDEIATIIKNYGLIKKAKGVKKSVVETKISFDDYVECLETFKRKTASQNLIRTDKHQVYSITQSKIALSPEDDKRYLIPGSFNTLPWGHYAIDKPQDVADNPMDVD
ncbi:uncharacterized protein LOC116174878 [Photinus pyralis]|uniref:uncharacterized protein LOC116173265 n=1 Tax=Photinus pyralis TaxID=7054 RepID=UPI0012674500|nr:uncharacterized protein LOC116173265 [Photinus pyralis]XP_031348766.1 uncharacterized protein LOC116174878 [Photinus pyralis]